MKNVIIRSLLVCTMLVLIGGSVFAVKPGETVNPNGFPEGEHYNLNIIGKNENFSCPCDYEPTEGVWDDTLETYVTKYKNVIFIPEYNDGKN